MSRRRVYVPAERLRGATATLGGDEHRHLARVLRLGPGDAIVLFDGDGGEVEAVITALDRKSVTLALGKRRTAPPPTGRITLLQAVVKGDRMDWIVQKTTELGVAIIVPVLAGRTVSRPAPDRARRWQTIAREASRQCGRADVPRIEAPASLTSALATAGAGLRIALWESSEGLPLRGLLAAGSAEVTLLVGPEGGFGSAEVDAAHAAGFQIAGLGPRILRAETAAVVAVALAQAAAGGLD